jgi:hypothetical protein
MRIGDKVRVVDKPISLLKSHAGRTAKIIKSGFGGEYLIKLDNGELWWTKRFDVEDIVDD